MLPWPPDHRRRNAAVCGNRYWRAIAPAHHAMQRHLTTSQACVSFRSAFTLVELVISMTILSFTTVVIGGLMLAVGIAWDHSTSLEDSRRQAQAAIARIKWTVQQSGVYRVSGQPTTLGLAVVSTAWGTYQAPSQLVVWSGGSNGGMIAQGTLSRLPLASELVVYVPDETSPARLMEVTFPGNTTAVDFRSSSFNTTIATLLKSNQRQSILLCDRLHVTAGTGSASLPDVANLRFEVTSFPTDSQIAAVAVGSQAWNDLSWAQGLIGADRALRTTNVRIEMLLDPDPRKPRTDNGYSTALPFPASVNRQYVYQP